MKRFGWITFVFVSLASARTFAQQIGDNDLKITPIASGFTEPVAMEFMGSTNDRYFVLEKASGEVVWVRPTGRSTVLDLPVDNASHHGLLGIALDPSFASNGFAYLYYSLSKTGADSGDPAQWAENRVSRFHWTGSGFEDERVMLTVPGDPLPGQLHNGGPLRFGPDGMLYGAIGEMRRTGAEQNNPDSASLSSNAGGIFRITTDPDNPIPADNPFVSVADPGFSKWYAYGVRNSFGLTFDPATGSLWDTENGESSYDEINHVTKGFNSGWTQIQGPLSRNTNTEADLVSLPNSHYSDPQFSFKEQTGITSAVFLKGSQWGTSYDNGLLVGDTNTGALSLLRLNATRDGFVLGDPNLKDLVADSIAGEMSSIVLGVDFAVPTDMRMGPDGAIYVLSYQDGTLYRIDLAPDPTKLWQNPALAVDVNRDGVVTPLDALIVINELNANGPHALPSPTGGTTSRYLDTTGDNSVFSLDALLVINYLNDQNDGSDQLLGQLSYSADQAITAVPEPSSLVLLLIGAIGFVIRLFTNNRCELA